MLRRKPILTSSKFYYIYALLLITLTYFFTGFYYEMPDDLVVNWLIQGKMGPRPVTEFYRFYIFWGDFLQFFYDRWPKIPWFGLWLYLLIWSSIGNLFVLIKKGLEKQFKPRELILFVTIVYVFFMIESVMYYSFARLAIILSAASFLMFYFELLYKQRLILLGIFTFQFWESMTLRPEFWLFSLAVILPALLVRFRLKKIIRQKKVILILSIFVIMISIGYKSVTRVESDLEEEFVELNYSKAKILDFLYEPDTSIMSSSDKELYEAVCHWYLIDENLTKEYFNRIVNGKRWNDKKYWNIKPIKSKLNELFRTLIVNYFHFIIVICYIYFFYFKEKGSKSTIRKGARNYNLYIISLILITTILFKMPERVFSPILMISLICIGKITLPYMNVKRIFKDNLIKIVLIIAIIGMLLKTGHRSKYSHTLKKRNEAKINYINKNYGQGYTIFSLYYKYLIYLDPMKVYQIDYSKNFFNLTGWIGFNPWYRSQLEYLTGSNKSTSIINFAADNDKAIFISPGLEVFSFFENFYEQLYGLNIHFELVEKKIFGISGNTIYVMKLKNGAKD